MIVRKRTSKSADGKKHVAYFMDYTHPGTKDRVRDTIQHVKTKAEADIVAARIFTDLVKSVRDGTPENATAMACITIEELLTEHRARPDMKSKWTLQYERIKADSIARLLPDTPCAAIKTATINDYVNRRQAEAGRHRKAGPATILKEIKIIRQAMIWGFDNDLCQLPVFKLPKLSIQKKKPRCLTPEELQLLFDACGPDTADLRQTVEFCYHTGLRWSELFSLRWDQINLKAGYVRFVTNKGGSADDRREDDVFLSDRVLVLLKTRQRTVSARSGLVFGVATGGYVIDGIETNSPWDMAKVIKRRAKRAGLSNPHEVTTRTLRHSCASQLLNLKATVPEVASHLRHRDGGALLLKTYAHAHEEGLRRVTNLLGVETDTFTAQKKKP